VVNDAKVSWNQKDVEVVVVVVVAAVVAAVVVVVVLVLVLGGWRRAWTKRK
jgi:hypothetical protein